MKVDRVTVRLPKIYRATGNNDSGRAIGDDLKEFGVDSLIYKALVEINDLKNYISEIQSYPYFSQSEFYSSNLLDIEKIRAKIRAIGRDNNMKEWIVSENIKELGRISNAEYVIFSYYPKLAAAAIYARTTARSQASVIYETGYQFEDNKAGGYIDGTNANAFVHSMWNAIIYTELVKKHKYDKDTAELLTLLATATHEYSDAGATKNVNWLSNVNMDMWNNKKGIEIAKGLIDNKYTSGLLGIENYGLRITDIAIRIVNAISSGNMRRNLKIDYNTNNHQVVAINPNSYALEKTNGDERNQKLIGEETLRSALYYLCFE